MQTLANLEAESVTVIETRCHHLQVPVEVKLNSPPPKKHLPEKFYTKNRKEKTKEKLIAMDTRKSLQEEDGKYFTPTANPPSIHISTTVPSEIYTNPPSPTTLAHNIITSIKNDTPQINKKNTKDVAKKLAVVINAIPKFELGK